MPTYCTALEFYLKWIFSNANLLMGTETGDRERFFCTSITSPPAQSKFTIFQKHVSNGNVKPVSLSPPAHVRVASCFCLCTSEVGFTCTGSVVSSTKTSYNRGLSSSGMEYFRDIL